MKPRLLDLFCGAGGAAVGYHRAGFEVVGVDIKPQPNYPFEFHQADALTLHANQGWASCWHMGDGTAFGGEWYPCVGRIHAVHASPPCQGYSALEPFSNKSHPKLVEAMRALLDSTGLPWVIENVPGAPLRADFLLCGSQFGLGVRRHRLFETSWQHFSLLPPCDHSRETVCVVGHGGGAGQGAKVKHWTKAEGAAAMDIDWMTRDELAQAIPPRLHRIHRRLPHGRSRSGACLVKPYDLPERASTVTVPSAPDPRKSFRFAQWQARREVEMMSSPLRRPRTDAGLSVVAGEAE